MIGQENIFKQLKQYTIDSFPHSVLLLGEKGCGKHLLLSEYIKPIILNDLPILDITKIISDEVLDEIYRTANPSIYLIDSDEITEKDQNTLLKFIEEPLTNSFIFILSQTRNTLLPTILNRCFVIEFEQYSKQQLVDFIDSKDSEYKDLILNLVRTPGKIKNMNFSNLSKMYDVCDKMLTKIKAANYSNTLSIADKINYKDEYDKFDIELFLNLLELKILEAYKNDDSEILYRLYQLTLSTRKKLIDSRINKQYLMYNFLSSFWRMSR